MEPLYMPKIKASTSEEWAEYYKRQRDELRRRIEALEKLVNLLADSAYWRAQYKKVNEMRISAGMQPQPKVER